MLAGIVLAKDPDLIRRIRSTRGLFGTILQPDECWMLGGRLPTVRLRMDKASINAQQIVERLTGNPKIKRVLYPTLFTDPEQKRIYAAQCDIPAACSRWNCTAENRLRSIFCGTCRSGEMLSRSAA